jgi:Flp pilus assembly protein TadD
MQNLCESALKFTKPKMTDLTNNLFQKAFQYHSANELLQAEQLYRAILEIEPNHPDANHNLGAIAVAMNELDVALPFFKHALENNSNEVQFWLSYIDALIKTQQLDLARDVLAQGKKRGLNGNKTQEFSQLLECYKLTTLFNQKKFVETETFARNLIEQFPEHGVPWQVLGATLQKQGRKHEALVPMQKAAELLPNVAEAHSNLGGMFLLHHDIVNAEKHCRRALELNENLATSYSNLAMVFEKLNRLDDAISLYQKAIMLDPDLADAHGNLGMLLLLKGDYERGLAEYQWFYHENSTSLVKQPLPKGSTPQWQGESLQNKTILLHHEQGFGDMIQFVRYAELLKKVGATVWALGNPALAELLKTVPWIDRVVKRGDKGSFDFWTLPLKLPYWFKTTLETVPCNVPYLSVNKAKSAWWKIWLDKQIPTKNKRIGLVWAGNPNHGNDENRSISFSELTIFSGLENITFVSLQLDEKSQNNVKIGLENLAILNAGAFIQDFDDSAALLNNLDLLITVDSAPAHLAGALNLPVWMLITKVPDWRWLLERTDSPWYSSMRLFRQPEIGNWASVLNTVKVTLKNEF